jgi:hypothetical protein
MTLLSRYIGSEKENAAERGFPNLVIREVPEGGFGKLMDAYATFHQERGIRLRYGRWRRDDNGRLWATWCFADSKDADNFAGMFGGQRIAAKA